MAETQNDVDVTEEASGGKSKMLIIIAVVVLILAGVGAFLFMGDEEKPEEAPPAEAATAVKAPPIYFSMEKPLIANFSKQSNDAVRYLSVSLKVMSREQTSIDAFTLHTPAIQHELLLLLFGQKYDELNTSAGKKALKAQILATINGVLKAQEHEGEINAVYITKLIMQ